MATEARYQICLGEFISFRQIHREGCCYYRCVLVHAYNYILAYWLSALRSRRTRLEVCTRLFALRPRVISYTLKETFAYRDPSLTPRHTRITLTFPSHKISLFIYLYDVHFREDRPHAICCNHVLLVSTLYDCHFR